MHTCKGQEGESEHRVWKPPQKECMPATNASNQCTRLKSKIDASCERQGESKVEQLDSNLHTHISREASAEHMESIPITGNLC